MAVSPYRDRAQSSRRTTNCPPWPPRTNCPPWPPRMSTRFVRSHESHFDPWRRELDNPPVRPVITPSNNPIVPATPIAFQAFTRKYAGFASPASFVCSSAHGRAFFRICFAFRKETSIRARDSAISSIALPAVDLINSSTSAARTLRSRSIRAVLLCISPSVTHDFLTSVRIGRLLSYSGKPGCDR